MLQVAPPSPDYVPGLEEPQTLPAPHDEDEHEPDEDEEDDEEDEEHLAPADSVVVIPTDELVSPPEGTELAAISFPSEAEVERLLAMPTPSPSLLTSLSPPSVGERLARCTAPSALPSPPLLPHVHMPPPVDRRDDILETEMPPRKRLYLSTLGSRDGSHSSHEDKRRNVQTAHPCFYADFIKCQPLNFKGTGGVVKFTTCTLLDAASTWWNSQIRSLGPDAYSMTWEVLKKKMREIKKLEIELWNLKASKPKTLDETIELATDLMDQKLRTYVERQTNNKRKADDSFINNHGTNNKSSKGKMSPGSTIWGRGTRDCRSSGNANVANAQRNNEANPKGNGCFECGAPGHFKRDYPKLKNKDGRKVNAPILVHLPCGRECREERECIEGLGFQCLHGSLIDIVPTPLGNSYDVELADGKIVGVNTIMQGCTLNFLSHPFNIDLMPVELGSFDVIVGMDWLRRYHAVIVCDEKLVRIPYGNETLTFYGNESNNGRESRLTVISCSKAQEQLKVHKQNYTTHDLELGSVVFALKIWRNYLYETKCTVFTDHKSLQHILDQKELNMRHRRWLELLSDYDCDIRYQPGKANVVADALSHKEIIEPLWVRALVMTICLDLPKQILEIQTEDLKL
nr:putative reverse transcriptase domain-containing protein [Tanacetum cinerariifolium]